MTAQEETKDLYSVIDLLADKVGRQLKKHLEKFKGKKIRSPSTGEVLSASRGDLISTVAGHNFAYPISYF